MTPPSLLNLADRTVNTEDVFFPSEVHRLSRVVARARLEGRVPVGCSEGLGASPPSAPTASPVLRTEPASGLGPDGRVSAGAIAPLPRITTRPVRCTSPDWSDDVRAEMDAIWLAKEKTK
jgi:hypothetical protein